MSVFRQIQNDIALLQEPARKFFRAGFFRFDRPFPLQGFLFERFKGCLHFGWQKVPESYRKATNEGKAASPDQMIAALF